MKRVISLQNTIKMPKVSRHGHLCFIGKPAENIPFENRKIITIYANKLYRNICNICKFIKCGGTKSITFRGVFFGHLFVRQKCPFCPLRAAIFKQR